MRILTFGLQVSQEVGEFCDNQKCPEMAGHYFVALNDEILSLSSTRPS